MLPPSPMLPPAPMLPPSPMLPPAPMPLPGMPTPSVRAAPRGPPQHRPPPASAGAPPPSPVPRAGAIATAAVAARLPGPAGSPRRPARPRPRVRLLYLLAGAVIAIAVALLFSSAHRTPAAGSRPAGTRAPPSPAAAPVPLTRTERWVNGLTTLQRRMNHAIRPGVPVSTDSLRHEAGIFRSCPRELAGLGPPARQLRPAHQLASRACASFGQAARCDITAARAWASYNPLTGATAKQARLLNSCVAHVNHGIDLIDRAAVNGSAIP